MNPKNLIFSLIIFVVVAFVVSCERDWNNPWDEFNNLSPEAWAPQNLQIEDVSITEKKLTWAYGDYNIEGFKIDRKKGDEPWQVAYQTLPKESRNWSDTEIIPDTSLTYEYRVYAFAGIFKSAQGYCYSGVVYFSDFSDSFETGNFTAGGWNVTGNAEISMQSPSQGSYCVQGPGTYNIKKTFSSITDNIVTIEYAMKASQTGSNCVSFAVNDQSDNYSASVFFRHTGYIVAYDGYGYNQQIDLMAYNADTWYEMKIVLNMSTKTYDVFIDGQLKADDFDFYNSGFTTPVKFSWGSGETWGTGWVDYVKIYNH